MSTNFRCAFCAPTKIIFMINRKFVFILPFLLVIACSKSKNTNSVKDVQQTEALVQTDTIDNTPPRDNKEGNNRKRGLKAIMIYLTTRRHVVLKSEICLKYQIRALGNQK